MSEAELGEFCKDEKDDFLMSKEGRKDKFFLLSKEDGKDKFFLLSKEDGKDKFFLLSKTEEDNDDLMSKADE